ncbi:MAG: hypothetical protein HY026_06625 [Deltaproteobacteria bacterium]|nr:hypothetical protein [Deltaproteobacteria bacterium]
MTGYKRVIDNYAIRHAMNEHGDPKTEEPRGQIALTKEDFQRIPDIVENPDKVESAGKSALGLDVIRYIKKDNGIIYHIEEIRKGRRHVPFLSMYKTKAGAASDAPLQSPAKSPSQASETFPPCF